MHVDIVDGQFVHRYTEQEERDYVWQKIFRRWGEWNWDERTFALRNYPDCISWEWVNRNYILPESMIREFKDYMCWNAVISQLHFCSKGFIEEIIDKFDEYNIQVTFMDREGVMNRLKEIIHDRETEEYIQS